MFLRLLFFAVLTSLSASAFAENHELKVIRRDIENDLSRLRFVFGLDLQSSSHRRGAILYRYPDVDPSFHIHFASEPADGKPTASRTEKTLSFLKPELHISFGSLSAAVSFTRYLRIESGVKFFSGGELIQMAKEQIQDHRRRPFSTEVFTRLESELTDWAVIGTQIEKDMNAHHGFHASVFEGLRVFQWIKQKREILEAWTTAELGFADTSHNTYLYGAGAGSGLSHYGVGLALEWPKVFWDLHIGSSFNYVGLLRKNRDASNVNHRPDYFVAGLSIQKSFKP